MLRVRLAPQLMMAGLVCSVTAEYSAHAQETFYKGKTIRLIVGLAPGGGYDLYSRVIAATWGHIPGNPTIVVENRVHGPSTRPYFLPPRTPKARVETLRKAYMDTLKDAEFLEEARKAKLDIHPDDGAGLERNVKEIFDVDSALLAKLKEILR